jgi:hypothetical protein
MAVMDLKEELIGENGLDPPETDEDEDEEEREHALELLAHAEFKAVARGLREDMAGVCAGGGGAVVPELDGAKQEVRYTTQ